MSYHVCLRIQPNDGEALSILVDATHFEVADTTPNLMLFFQGEREHPVAVFPTDQVLWILEQSTQAAEVRDLGQVDGQVDSHVST